MLKLTEQEREKIQEIVNLGYLGVIKQGQPSYDDILNSCRYRDSAGNKCVIGFSIPDEIYTAKMEGSIHQLIHECPSIFGPNFSNEGIKMLLEFQSCHDGSRSASILEKETFISVFKRRCIIFAENNNFTLPEILDGS